MRKFSLFLLSISLIAIYSSSIYAGPPTDGVCGPLKEDGVTKGLYGLCIAYHASGASNQVILDNYNKKKGPSDPVMPGTDDNPPTLSCPCWNTLSAEDIGADQENVPPAVCFLSPDLDQIIYQSTEVGGDSENLAAADGACLYTNSATGADYFDGNLSDLQEQECRLEILDLAIRDFQEFITDCL